MYKTRFALVNKVSLSPTVQSFTTWNIWRWTCPFLMLGSKFKIHPFREIGNNPPEKIPTAFSPSPGGCHDTQYVMISPPDPDQASHCSQNPPVRYWGLFPPPPPPPPPPTTSVPEISSPHCVLWSESMLVSWTWIITFSTFRILTSAAVVLNNQDSCISNNQDSCISNNQDSCISNNQDSCISNWGTKQ